MDDLVGFKRNQSDYDYLRHILLNLDEEKQPLSQVNFKQLYRYSQSKDEAVRWTLAEILFWDPSNEATKLLLKMMTDENILVRCDVVESLSGKETHQVLSKIFNVVQFREEENEIVCTYAVHSFFDLYCVLNKDLSFLKSVLEVWFNELPYIHTKLTLASLLYQLGDTSKRTYLERQQSKEESDYAVYADILLERLIRAEEEKSL